MRENNLFAQINFVKIVPYKFEMFLRHLKNVLSRQDNSKQNLNVLKMSCAGLVYTRYFNMIARESTGAYQLVCSMNLFLTYYQLFVIVTPKKLISVVQ